LKYRLIVSFVFITLILGLLLLGINFLTPYEIAVVNGISMLPLISDGDLTFSREINPENVKVGDDLIYENSSGELIIHRVIRISNDRIQTQGINRITPDNPISYAQVRGILISVIHIQKEFLKPFVILLILYSLLFPIYILLEAKKGRYL